MVKKMRAIQVSGPNKRFELVERDIPEPTKGTVRIRVQACGICHSDAYVVDGSYPGVKYPRVPGHEAAGVIDAVGPEVTTWKVGQRVGVGWTGGYCGQCESCRKGDFVTCLNKKIAGISFDGGYADYMIAPIEGLALIPDDLNAVDAGPLMCAGVTTFNSLRNSGAKAGDVVAILGIGGLGHLAVQYAAKMGFHTVAIARGEDKAPLAKKLGAHHYIDSNSQKAGQELQKLGGARVVLATVTNKDAIEAAIAGLGIDGQLIILGIPPEPINVLPRWLISGRRSISGWPSGSSKDSQETLFFSSFAGVRSVNQIFPLEKAQEAYDLMMSGKARFRVVLEISH